SGNHVGSYNQRGRLCVPKLPDYWLGLGTRTSGKFGSVVDSNGPHPRHLLRHSPYTCRLLSQPSIPKTYRVANAEAVSSFYQNRYYTVNNVKILGQVRLMEQSRKLILARLCRTTSYYGDAVTMGRVIPAIACGVWSLARTVK